jgi:hypothetical protein
LPSALCWWGAFRRTVLLPLSAAALDTVSGLGLLLFLLLVALELDFRALAVSGGGGGPRGDKLAPVYILGSPRGRAPSWLSCLVCLFA